MRHTFCTITSKSYNVFTLALISKIESKVFILCLDNFSYNFFKKFKKKNIILVKLNELTTIYNINKIYNNRNYLSFIFTLKPILIFYVLNKIKKKNFIIYLDSDIYFIGNPNKLLENINNSSIFLTKHNFSKKNRDKKRFGIFNAGFVAFCSDFYGKKYLKLWMIQCIKCCDLNVAKNIWGDQIYLNKFNKKNNRVKFLNTEIFNLAPWNISNYSISINDNKLLKYDSYHLFEGLGMPIKGEENKFGNLVVKYNIMYPPTLSDKQKDNILKIFGKKKENNGIKSKYNPTLKENYEDNFDDKKSDEEEDEDGTPGCVQQ